MNLLGLMAMILTVFWCGWTWGDRAAEKQTDQRRAVTAKLEKDDDGLPIYMSITVTRSTGDVSYTQHITDDAYKRQDWQLFVNELNQAFLAR